MSKKGAYHASLRAKNKPDIYAFIDDLKLEYRWLAGDWHMRVEGKFDIYPTRKRWFNVVNKARGGFRDYDELGRIFFEQMELTEEK